MSDKGPKELCRSCGKWVRRLGKHMNQKHPLESVVIREGETA